MKERGGGVTSGIPESEPKAGLILQKCFGHPRQLCYRLANRFRRRFMIWFGGAGDNGLAVAIEAGQRLA